MFAEAKGDGAGEAAAEDEEGGAPKEKGLGAGAADDAGALVDVASKESPDDGLAGAPKEKVGILGASVVEEEGAVGVLKLKTGIDGAAPLGSETAFDVSSLLSCVAGGMAKLCDIVVISE